MNEHTIKIAILDMYNGEPNQGMRCIIDIINRFNQIVSFKIFDVRRILAEDQIDGRAFDANLAEIRARVREIHEIAFGLHARDLCERVAIGIADDDILGDNRRKPTE